MVSKELIHISNSLTGNFQVTIHLDKMMHEERHCSQVRRHFDETDRSFLKGI